MFFGLSAAMSRSAAAVKRCLFSTSICGSFLCTPGVLPMKAKYVMLPRLSPNRARSKTVLTFPWSIFATCPFRPVCVNGMDVSSQFTNTGSFFCGHGSVNGVVHPGKKMMTSGKKGCFPVSDFEPFCWPQFWGQQVRKVLCGLKSGDKKESENGDQK